MKYLLIIINYHLVKCLYSDNGLQNVSRLILQPKMFETKVNQYRFNGIGKPVGPYTVLRKTTEAW